jgi:hypothetical protein
MDIPYWQHFGIMYHHRVRPWLDFEDKHPVVHVCLQPLPHGRFHGVAVAELRDEWDPLRLCVVSLIRQFQ